jgi:hypothetical protein
MISIAWNRRNFMFATVAGLGLPLSGCIYNDERISANLKRMAKLQPQCDAGDTGACKELEDLKIDTEVRQKDEQETEDALAKKKAAGNTGSGGGGGGGGAGGGGGGGGGGAH